MYTLEPLLQLIFAICSELGGGKLSALWERRDFNPEIVEKLCTQLVINKKIAILLAQRGIQTADEAR